MESWESLSDEELILLAKKDRERSGEIVEFLLEKYKPLVKKKARTLFLIGGEREDLIQEGMIGLFRAIEDYRREKKASFYTFASLCIDRQMYGAIEKQNRRKHSPLNEYVSMSEIEGGEEFAKQRLNPEKLLIDQENLDKLFMDIQKLLSSFELRVLDLYLEGNDYRQIAKHLKKSEKSIDNALQRIKGKLRMRGIY
ncbi:MAG TPA: sigma-70 family RNA polymerase sigma factor [Lachnospiraceae bacterium]